MALNSDQRFKLWMRGIDGAVSILKIGVPWGAGVAIAGYVASIFIALSGKGTLAIFGIGLITSIHIDQWAAYIIAMIGGGYGLRQRHLRREAIKRLTERPLELELLMDPERSTSGLTPAGTTRQEDR